MTDPEHLLEEQGFYAATVHGISMEPLLRDHRDTVYIERADTLHKRDVVLYRRRNGQLVLHRLLTLDGDVCTVSGDNDLTRETLDRSRILGVMTAFSRGDHEATPVSSRRYRLYSRVWTFSFPTKRILRKLYHVWRRFH